MRNQHKFDLVTLRAPKDDPEVGGDYYGLPWPCWGTPEIRHPGSPILYNADAAAMDGGNGIPCALRSTERNGQTLLAEGSYLPGSEIKDGYPEFTMGVLKKLGWDKDLTAAELATIEKVAGSPTMSIRCRGRRIFPAASSVLRSSTAVHPTATARRARSPGTCPIPSRCIASRSTRPRIDLVAKYPTLPDAKQFRLPNIGFSRAESWPWTRVSPSRSR